MSYERQVTAGVDLLNRVNPGWEDRVNLDTLKMGSCSKCILGQLYGNYALGVQDGGITPTVEQDMDCGFLTTAGQYDSLQQEWIRQILALREEKKALRELENVPVLV